MHTRRNLLLSTLFGASALGLRALATGVPLSLLASPRLARAEPPEECAGIAPQFLVLITSSNGDPLNANVPGCYEAGDQVYHSPLASMQPTPVNLGGVVRTGAQAWASLPEAIRQRTCFFHHATYTNAHGDAPKVQKLMGAVRRQEMMVSMFAQNLAPCLETVQSQPIVLSSTLISSNGQVQPVINPPSLKKVLAKPNGPLARLRELRDADLDRLNALFKENGRTSDIALLDRYALSQAQARDIKDELLGALDSINGNTPADLNKAAAVLIRMRVSPVVVMRYAFGGDNHTDNDLTNEANQTATSVANLDALYTQLGDFEMQDQTTIAVQNVFGRTLNRANRPAQNVNGRDHNSAHHCTVLIGKGLRGSVIGGIEPNSSGRDYQATSINSATGASVKGGGGDVPYNTTLESVGKTLGTALGLQRELLDAEIEKGVPIAAALA